MAVKNYNKIKTGDILIGIEKQNLKLQINGIVNKIDKNLFISECTISMKID